MWMYSGASRLEAEGSTFCDPNHTVSMTLAKETFGTYVTLMSCFCYGESLTLVVTLSLTRPGFTMGIFSSYNKLHMRWGTGRREVSWCKLFASVYISAISILLHHFMNLCQAKLYKTQHPTSQTGDRCFFSTWQVIPIVYLHCVCSLACIFQSAAANLCNTSDDRDREVIIKDLC